ncbi:unnamed protein product [Somion occarium]|uniref:Fungal-type protein kinase domain-containing protein n=1 Tax=Somion occarium TaxID=3059160 RepID=A0ABP1CS57_9APHY
MVLFPRYWFGLPYPPEYLALHGIDTDIDMPDTTYASEEEDILPELPKRKQKAYSTPNVLNLRATTPLGRAASDVPRTPVRSNLMQTKTEKGYEDKLVKEFLRMDFQNKTDIGYDVVDFVRHVWKFSPEDIPRRDEGYQFDHTNCRLYAMKQYIKYDGLKTQRITGERACCSAFENIVKYICKDLDKARPSDGTRFPGILKFLHDRTPASDFANFKPDFGYGPDVELHGQEWANWGAYGELKKREATQEKTPKVTNEMINELQGIRKKQKTQPLASSSREGNIPPVDEGSTSIRKRKSTADQPSASSKRYKAVKGTYDATFSHTVVFTGNDMQSAKYANELASHGIRNFASGFLVEDTKMTLWYADRMGLVKSKGFDVFKEPAQFLLVIAALHFASRATLGFNPLIRYGPDFVKTYENGVLALPYSYDIDGKKLNDMTFALDVSAGKQPAVAYGAVGRGTTVVPIKAVGAAQDLFGDDDLVAKMSWQPVNRVNTEDGIVRVIRQKIGKSRTKKYLLKHIVDMKCSLDLTSAELGLPRASMYLPEAYEPRIFRVLIVKEYLPLECVRSLAEFKQIIIDVVQVHHYVFIQIKILHRDISITNVMFYREPGGHVVGVLSDWDLSTYRNGLLVKGEVESDLTPTIPKDDEQDPKDAKDDSEEEQPTRKKARYRTGTGPFMALDLLSTTTILHRYRHDLESFFYLLCYFCATFVPPKADQTKGSFRFLPGWEHSDLKKVCSAKKAFLGNHDGGFRALFTEAHESYRPLFDKWIRPLYTQFKTVPSIASQLEDNYGWIMEAREAKDSKEEKKYLKAVNQIIVKADKVYMYKNFIDVLLK